MFNKLLTISVPSFPHDVCQQITNLFKELSVDLTRYLKMFEESGVAKDQLPQQVFQALLQVYVVHTIMQAMQAKSTSDGAHESHINMNVFSIPVH